MSWTLEKSRAHRATLRDEGRCRECREPNPTPEFVACLACREKRRRTRSPQAATGYIPDRQARTRPTRAMCVVCRRWTAQGVTRCRFHKDTALERIEPEKLFAHTIPDTLDQLQAACPWLKDLDA